jgi:hypothetical protein
MPGEQGNLRFSPEMIVQKRSRKGFSATLMLVTGLYSRRKNNRKSLREFRHMKTAKNAGQELVVDMLRSILFGGSIFDVFTHATVRRSDVISIRMIVVGLRRHPVLQKIRWG